MAYSVATELSQLYHAPWIDGLRATRLGGLVLGFGFLWSDLIAHAAGVLGAAVLARAVAPGRTAGGLAHRPPSVGCNGREHASPPAKRSRSRNVGRTGILMAVAENDNALLRAWGEGDRAAGDALVRQHFASVYRFLRRRLVDPAATKDLAQRTFLACLEHRGTIDVEIRFRAWAIGIARNLLLRHMRDHARAQQHQVVAVPEVSAPSPSGVAVAHQERSILLAAMQSLPEDLRATIELHYWEELTTREIGAVLGIAAGTVKWRLSRARTLLRERIEAAPAPPLARAATLRRLAQVDRGLTCDDDEPEAPE